MKQLLTRTSAVAGFLPIARLACLEHCSFTFKPVSIDFPNPSSQAKSPCNETTVAAFFVRGETMNNCALAENVKRRMPHQAETEVARTQTENEIRDRRDKARGPKDKDGPKTKTGQRCAADCKAGRRVRVTAQRGLVQGAKGVQQHTCGSVGCGLLRKKANRAPRARLPSRTTGYPSSTKSPRGPKRIPTRQSRT